LAICRTIVEAHGGTIRYEHTDEPRTRFIVELPIDAAVERDS
jgi:signal transduction histidine kinase